MVLSVELWTLKNQIAKRISATKSITAKSEYGSDILAGSIPFLLYIIFANYCTLKKGLQGLLITLIRGENAVLSEAKFFGVQKCFG